MATNIKLIKLLNGVDLMAEVTSQTDSIVRIKNPLRIVVIPTKAPNANPTVGLAEWAEFSTDKEFTLDKAHVLVIMNPVKEFENQYNTVFGSIITPASSIIIPGQ